MNRKLNTKTVIISALLCAIGIIIPLFSPIKIILEPASFSLIIGIIHGACEVLIVMPFYFGTSLSDGYYDKGFLVAVVGLVGVGTVIHSMVDMGLSVYIWNVLPKEVRRNSVVTQKA